MHLQDVSVEGYMRRKRHSEDMLKEAERFDSSLLSKDELLILSLFTAMHRDLVNGIDQCPLYLFPINSMGAGGVLFSFVESVEWMPFNTSEDYEVYLQRLQACPKQLDQFVSAMKEGINRGIVASTAMIRDVESQLEKLIGGNFNELRVPLSTAQASALLDQERRAAFDLAIDNVKNAFSSFLTWFHDVYVEVATLNPSCSALPNGPAIYAACLR